MTEPQPKRRPGRPKSTTPPPPDHNLRMPAERWQNLGAAASATGSDRTKILNRLAAWFIREPGATLPRRPAPEGTAGDPEQEG